MYFSKNSRYVLQKAQFLPPAFLKATEKNLSVKKPKDDPTKPALRVNIPEETTSPEGYSKFIRNSGVNSRSRSLMSRTNSTALEDELLARSESDIEFSKFGDILAKTDFEKETRNPQMKYNFRGSKDECDEALGANIDNTELRKYSSVENTSKVKASEGPTNNQGEEIVDSKGLYIIIDVPEKCEVNSTQEIASENIHSTQRDDFAVKTFSDKPHEREVKSEAERKAESSLRKTQSFPHIRSNQFKTGSNRRFEVHETEDAATYIFHLRFNKNVRSRPSRVGCVPEKEITTRNDTQNFTDGPIKVRETVLKGGQMKEIDVVKYAEAKKRQKANRSEAQNEEKTNLLGVNKAQSQQETETKTSVDATDFVDPQQKILRDRLSHIMEEKKTPRLFERDDFDNVRSASATAFRPPEIHIEKKLQEIVSDEVLTEMSFPTRPEAAVAEATKISYTALDKFNDSASTQYENPTASSKQEYEDCPAAISAPVSTESLNSFTDYYQSNELEVQNAVESTKMGAHPKFYIPSRRSGAALAGESHNAQYLTIHEPDSAAESQKPVESTTTAEGESEEYLNANDLKSTFQNLKNNSRSPHDKKKLSESSKHSPKKLSKTCREDNESADFQTSASYVSIGCEKIPSSSMTFSLAFPPLLKEALNRRFKLKKDFLCEKWTKIQITPKDPQMYNVSELSANSILFPKKENEKFDCEALLSSSEEIISNIVKTSEKENNKISDTAFTEKSNKASVDSLTVMKQVKNIIQLDLDNVVKIFKDRNFKEISSVILSKGDEWKVDYKELEEQIEKRRSEMKMDCLMGPKPQKGFSGDKIESTSKKYLPPKSESNDLKLEDQSAIRYNPNTNEFFISKEGLADAISRKTTDSYDEIVKTLGVLAKENVLSLASKNGDSILVFDEETQSWKVDFSILEKREQQLQLEEELTKRSELILETLENFEKGQLSMVPKPESTEKKTFDYRRKEWNAYSTNESSKSKSLFREPNAEEIRKKNSDLYEDLFIAKKKESALNNSGKQSPGSETSKTPKESKMFNLKEIKAASAENSSTPQKPENPKPQAPPPSSSSVRDQPTKTEEENFWESFLKMDILPKDIKDITSIKPPVAPPSPSSSELKIEDPKSKVPEKKIEEPKFKIHLPFIGDKKSDKSKAKKPPPSKGESGSKSSSQAPSKSAPDSKKDPPKTEGKKESSSVLSKSTSDSKNDSPKTPSKSASESKKDSSQVSSKSTSETQKELPRVSSKSTPESKKEQEVKAPPASPEDPKTNTSLTVGKSEKTPAVKEDKKPESNFPPLKPVREIPGVLSFPSSSPKETQVPKPPTKPEKTAAATDHYVSDNIIEISRNKTKDNEPKITKNKIETVKLNITADKRLPSKVTEINLNKTCDKKTKEMAGELQNSLDAKSTDDSTEKKQELQKNFEKYKTPFSDPEYEEKPMKIKSDMESNPNLKKLENWNKTLVLHDIMKPPENIESWLKDETDKMATLLLKILQEASDGKPKKKQPLSKPKGGDKQSGKGNPYESIRKKQENSPENFLFRVRTVNLSLDDKKDKPEDLKVTVNEEQIKDIPVQSGKTAKPPKTVEATKLPTVGKDTLASTAAIQQKAPQLPVNVEDFKNKLTQTALETVIDSNLISRDIVQHHKPPLEITEDIPGPELLKKISNTWKVFPVLGSQMTIFTLLRLFQLVNMGSTIFGPTNPSKCRKNAFSKLFTKYGPIVNVQGPLSGNVILIHKPEHLNAVFEQDATIPARSVFDSLEQCRRDAEEKFVTLGFYTDWSKPEWNELRKGTCDPLIKGCDKYLSTAEMAGDSLVSNIRRNKNGQNLVSEDFMEEIRKWSLEGLCTILFEKSFGFLEGRTNSLTWIMEPDKLYMALEEATDYLSKCERGFQTWRLIPTPSSTGLAQAYRNISSILSKQLYQAEVNLRNKSVLLKDGSLRDLTFVESMLLNDGMAHEEIICNLVDILLIGTNSMNSSLGFLLYNLAENVKVQNKLFKELQEALPSKTSRQDFNQLSSLKYLQACVKENLRLHMPVPIFYRQLQNDILLSNYVVPKGTYVVMDYRVSCLKEQIYDDADRFVPERWINDEKWMHDINPFAPIPFCHGPRAEFTKRVVEMQLASCLAKIIRNFQVEYHYGEIHGTESIITYPNKPLKLNFVERES